MVHPSSVAVDYIWDRFCEATLSNSAKATLPKVMKIVKAAEHRPSNPYSPQHAELCRRQLEAIEALPEVDFGKESAYFKINL